MSKLPSKNSTMKLGAAHGTRVERNSKLVQARETVDLAAIFGEPNFSPKNLSEQVVESSNMIRALLQVERNKGSAGVDGLCVEDLRGYFQNHWKTIRPRLLSGEYKVQPVKRVSIPKPDGGHRELGIPTCVDRVIQQAMSQVLGRIFEPTFSESSYGFRPKRSAHDAITKAKAFVSEGHRIVVDIDLEKFFDRVNHDILMERISRRVQDKSLLRMIRRYLEAGVMDGGLVEARQEGTPQGGPLSPLLSNILLDDLDKELERRGHLFCRYADDCNVYVRSRKAGERVKKSVTEWLKRRLKLTVNEGKSAVDQVSKRKFLGYSMVINRGPKLKPAKASIVRFKNKIRELFRKGRGRNIERFIKYDLNPLLRGWVEYFKLSDVKLIFEELDGWIRRKLRALKWRQWKTGRNRYRNFIALGLRPEQAKRSCSNGHGPWWNSAKAHMVVALPNKYFDQMRLINLQTRVQKAATCRLT